MARKQARAVELADFYMKWKNLSLNDAGYAELLSIMTEEEEAILFVQSEMEARQVRASEVCNAENNCDSPKSNTTLKECQEPKSWSSDSQLEEPDQKEEERIYHVDVNRFLEKLFVRFPQL